MNLNPIQSRAGDIAATALAGIQQQTLVKCQRVLDRRWGTSQEVAFSHITALQLMGIEVPLISAAGQSIATKSPPNRSRKMRIDELHACVPIRNNRSDISGINLHVWNHDYNAITIADSFHCVSPVDAWKQMAAYLTPGELVVLADSMMRRDPRLKRAIPRDFSDALGKQEIFIGKAKCRKIVNSIRENTDSSQESRTRFWLEMNGLKDGLVNYEVRDPENGKLLLVDIAYPHLRLIIEYDGKHHNDAEQRLKDIQKRERLRKHGWIVVEIRSVHLRSAQSRQELLETIFSQINIVTR